MKQVIISLIATAMAIIDAELSKLPASSQDAQDFVDAKNALFVAIAELRGDANKIEVTENVVSRIKERRAEKEKKDKK